MAFANFFRGAPAIIIIVLIMNLIMNPWIFNELKTTDRGGLPREKFSRSWVSRARKCMRMYIRSILAR